MMIQGLSGAGQAFSILQEDFANNSRVQRRAQAGNPYTFRVDLHRDKFISVYDYEDEYCIRLTFGPVRVCNAVKQNLEVNFGIDWDIDIEHRRRYGANPDVVTLEFYDEDDDCVLPDNEISLMRKVADAVVDALEEM